MILIDLYPRFALKTLPQIKSQNDLRQAFLGLGRVQIKKGLQINLYCTLRFYTQAVLRSTFCVSPGVQIIRFRRGTDQFSFKKISKILHHFPYIDQVLKGHKGYRSSLICNPSLSCFLDLCQSQEQRSS